MSNEEPRPDEYPEYNANDWIAAPVVTLKMRMLTSNSGTRLFKLPRMRPDLTATDIKAIAGIMISRRDIYKYKPIALAGASINMKISRYLPVSLE